MDRINRILSKDGMRAASRGFALAIALLFSLGAAQEIQAQSPNAAASGAAKSDEGFYPGWSLGTRFEGSTSGDGSVYDLGFGAGYNFSHHFGVSLGIPYYFVGTPTVVKSKNPQAVSGSGLGNVGADLKWLFPGPTVNYASTIHLGAPSGDMKKGFSTGHATWNWTNHIEHGWGNFTPFIDGGVGNTVQDTRYFHRPFMTFGYTAQFEAGTAADVGPFSISASAYDVAPWGTQTVVSRVFRCSGNAKCGANAKSTNRKGYLDSSVQSGDASLARDNGFNASVEVKPAKTIDLEFDYSRSVPLRLSTFSFGIGLDLGAVLRRASVGH
ncbi:MAG: hypothetical protein JWO71_3887 [Candidatus Acidoferrum typicum]|nr:hypothetical protein [Candidatus Acidoferrum typicum]